MANIISSDLTHTDFSRATPNRQVLPVNRSAFVSTEQGRRPAAGGLLPKANNQHIRFRGAFKFPGEQSEAAHQQEEGQLDGVQLGQVVDQLPPFRLKISLSRGRIKEFVHFNFGNIKLYILLKKQMCCLRYT